MHTASLEDDDVREFAKSCTSPLIVQELCKKADNDVLAHCDVLVGPSCCELETTTLKNASPTSISLSCRLAVSWDSERGTHRPLSEIKDSATWTRGVMEDLTETPMATATKQDAPSLSSSALPVRQRNVELTLGSAAALAKTIRPWIRGCQTSHSNELKVKALGPRTCNSETANPRARSTHLP